MAGMSTSQHKSSRRKFLKASTLVAGAAAVHVGTSARAAEEGSIKIGLIGCGGRGSGAAAQAISADKNVFLTAMGDAFPDRLSKSLDAIKKQHGDRVQVDEKHCFVGLDAYKRVIDSGVDVVLLTEPPGFRPQHMAYAVAAGKHVFAEKPMATDAPGVRSVAKTVEEARRKNLAMVAGFNGRYSPGQRALHGQIAGGAIGKVSAMYTTFNTGYLWSFPRKPEWSDMEWQVRNWYYFTWLSGDHLVEQAVHNVDKLIWTMNEEPPARAMAVGGRQVRVEPMWGNIYDHFAVVYEWEDGTRGFLFARQQERCANDVSDHFIGTKGNADIARGQILISGEKPWKFAGESESGHQREHVELFASIRAGKPINDGDRMVKSTLAAIMGRMAAYTGQVITWKQAMESQEGIVPEKIEWGPFPTPPVAMPGKTKFV